MIKQPLKTARKPKKKKPKKRLHTKQEALKLAQKYARLRDTEGGNKQCKCISCGKPLSFEQTQGGHYIPRGCACISDDLDNINAQCMACNMYEGGNFIGYKDGLTRKIGKERVERLENMYRASRGSEEALELLSTTDRLKVNEKRSKKYWDNRYTELREMIQNEFEHYDL